MTLRVVPFVGLQPYEPVWRAMQSFTKQRTAQTCDEIWLLEHEPVYTLGQATKPEHLLNTEGAAVVQTDRGGQVTWHGPGQLMFYCLFDVKRLGLGARALVSTIEAVTVKALAACGITAYARADRPGVYVDLLTGEAKIAALGLRIKASGSYHGLCVNFDCALDAYQAINPCGYAGMAATRITDLVSSSKQAFIDLWLASLQQELSGHLEYEFLAPQLSADAYLQSTHEEWT